MIRSGSRVIPEHPRARDLRRTPREPGQPLLATLLLYLDADWAREWDAETLFLDGPTGTGVFVRPRGGRAVIMDQDVTHRISTPSKVSARTLATRGRALCAAVCSRAGGEPRQGEGSLAGGDRWSLSPGVLGSFRGGRGGRAG